MKRSKRDDDEGEMREDAPSPVVSMEEDNQETNKSKFLAFHATPDSKGNVQVGAAYLDCMDGRLTTLGRTIAWEGEVAFLFQMLLDLCQPVDAILISSKLGESYVEAVEDTLKEIEGQVPSIILPSAFFDFTNSCKLIGSRFGMAHALGSVIDLTNKASTSCAGAVFSHAQRIFPALPPIEFDLFDLGKFLVIDGGSMKALDVVKSEEHPSVIRGRGRAKEGFTLLSLLDRTKSSLGARTLRRWVLRPLTYIDEIEQRYDSVEFLCSRMGQESIAKISKFLAQVGDLPRSLLRLKTCTATSRDWMLIGESLTNLFLCFQLLKQVKDNTTSLSLPIILENALAASDAPGLFEVGRALDLIDWDALKESNRVVPIQGASEQVDEARRRLQALPDFLTVETQQANTPGLTIRCIPVIGFVAAIEHSCAIQIDQEPGFQFLFEAKKQQQQDGDNVEEEFIVRYFKTARTRFLDEELGDIIGISRDLEDTFVRQVEEVVLAHEADLLLATHRSAELDVLLSFAEVAHDFNYVRPQLTSEPETVIRAARHPLLERVLDDKFVPSDIELKNRVLIITGPNFSGKSVILKTVALLSILAQIGSFVPAESARLGIVDRIFTRMSGLETVCSAQIQRESSFSIDVQQVVSMLRCCTPSSLLCIDEFGKGTNTVDGAALLASVVRYLNSGKVGQTPRVILATHLVEIFDAKLVDDTQVVFGEMRVEFQSDGEPVPLFRLMCSSTDDATKTRDSYGIACAKRVGVCQPVVDRAFELCERMKHNQPLFDVNNNYGQAKDLHKEHAVKDVLGFSPTWTDSDLERFFTNVI